MKKVEVKDIPVRYNGTTYQPGESFEMASEHVLENLVNVLGDVEVEKKPISEMTLQELKDYAAEFEIDLGEAKKKDEVFEIVQAFENGEQESEESPEE